MTRCPDCAHYRAGWCTNGRDAQLGRMRFELRRMQADGQDAEEVLWTSVTNGWSGVFPIRRKGWAPAEVAHTPDKRAEQFTLAMQERAQTRSAPPPGLRTRVARGLLADREDDA
jgi:hypothetical protein